MKIACPEFQENAFIPQEFTCDGDDKSPPLRWRESPPNTRSYVLIVDDPDAPSGTFTHWVLYNIPAFVHSLEKNQPRQKVLKNGAYQGLNDFKKIGYGGPCPPEGSHRYRFKLYALDNQINPEDIQEPTREKIMKAINGHILADTQMVGRYSRGEMDEDEKIDEAGQESFPASDSPPWNY